MDGDAAVRVGISTVGTRGDIEPFVALAHTLIGAGHEVAFAAPRDAAHLVAGMDARYVEMDLELRAVFRSQQGQRWLAAGDVESFLAGIAAMLSGASRTIGESVLAVAEGADVLITAINTEDYAVAVSQARGVPVVLVHLTPWLTTDEYPQPLTPQDVPQGGEFSRRYNLETFRRAEEVYWQGKRDDINAFRASLGLDPAPRSVLGWTPELGLPVLQAFSTELVRRPASWGPQSTVTGFWRLPAEVRELIGEARMPEPLDAWLAAGEPPVYLGFGSMPVLEPEKVLDMVVRAARLTGLRLLVGTGWSDLPDGAAGSLPDDVRLVGAVDHDRLLPRCRAVVHHGGVGTTAAGLIAGLPTWAFTVFGDQDFWGGRIARLKVGGYDRFVDFDFDHLLAALDHTAREDVRREAAALGERLRAEDGLACAMRTLDRLVG